MVERTEEGADPSGPATAIVGLITAAIVVASVVGLQAAFYHVQGDEIQTKVIDVRNEELIQNKSTELENLNSYRWVDESAGRAAIPIDRAMSLVVSEHRSGSGGYGQ